MKANPLAGRVPEGTPGVCAALRMRAQELSDRASPLTGTVVANLAAEINAEHDAAHRDAETAVQHAVRCGEQLLTVKASLKHGEFMLWIEKNCQFEQSTATRYMKAAHQIATGVGISSIRGLFPSGTVRNHRAQSGVDHGEHVVDDADHDGVQRPIGGAREHVVDHAGDGGHGEQLEKLRKFKALKLAWVEASPKMRELFLLVQLEEINAIMRTWKRVA